MIEPSTVHALRELVDRGLVAAQPGAQPLPGGNADRRVHPARSSWRVNLPDGRTVRLSLGPDLAGLKQRHGALANACPALVPALVFFESLGNVDALAVEFFEGDPLELVAEAVPERAQQALARVRAQLAATTRGSTEQARRAEWEHWTCAVESLECWQPSERQLLHDFVWPALYPRLCGDPPALRWTNGDFTSANVLVNASGDARLIDSEFAVETHFFAEDAVRFHILSPSARQWPDLFASILPPRGPAWHLFFWLRQLALESATNSPAYLARVRPARLGLVRRLSEQVTGHPFTGWSVDATPVHFNLEAARWEQTAATALRLAGWCYVPGPVTLRRLVVFDGETTLATAVPAERADVQAHFDAAAEARNTGFSLAVPLRDPGAPLLLAAVTADGSLLPFYSCRASDLPGRGPWVDDYSQWAAIHDPDPPAPPATEAAGPFFSLLLPTYNTPPEFLRACLESVRSQYHVRWELCVVDDGSSVGGVAPLLREFAAADRRVRVLWRATNGGIARATNDALAAARGEFIVLLDHDDILRPHALAEIAARLQQEPALDVVYSDEDKITADNQRVVPFLKPDFSPEHLLGVMYIGHVLCVRTAVARQAGGFDSTYDGVQDYEFFLRVTEHTRRIGHVPRMLYHWRQSPGSSALHGNVKGDMDEKQAAAVRQHLQRRGRTEHVVPCGGHRVQLYAVSRPSVELVRPVPGEQSAAALRQAANRCQAEVLVLMTGEPLDPDVTWLGELAALAALPDSGLVAPLLLGVAGRVLESGWTVGVHGAAPVMSGFEAGGDGYNGSLTCTREVAAVSPLCCAVRRTLVLTALGHSPAGESWLDLCLRLRAQGFFHRVCATARVQLAAGPDPARLAGRSPTPDPFLNPHFDPARADYALARPAAHLSPVCWHLDTPSANELSNGGVHLRGWCFTSGSNSLRSIRLCTDEGQTLFGATGLPRPDVKAVFPEAPNDSPGFEIRGALPAGRRHIALEAGFADGTWVGLMTRSVDVRRRLLPRWLGGGTWTELMIRQVPTNAIHAPRSLVPEDFPRFDPVGPRPRFSIVTPSYQQSQFLDETIRSVLDQQNAKVEYVVQDGGSTDGSADIVRRHAPRLHAWASAADLGQADAIQRGFARTGGSPEDLMAWLNSDDFYLPGALAFVAGYFARHPEVDVLYGHRVLVDEQSREIGRWFLPAHDDQALRVYDFVPQETLFWRRRVWEQVGGVDPSFKFALDWDLFLRFQAAGARIVRVPCFLACFRLHAAQKTSAAMHDAGQREIDALRNRTFGRHFTPQELETHPRLIRYLRKSAWLEFRWRLGTRLRQIRAGGGTG